MIMNRDEEMVKEQEKLMKDSELLGGTAIEDKLQD